MVFDTTASNTGKHTGAAVILERRFKRKFTWIVYCHHTFGLDVRNVCKRLFKKEDYNPLPIDGEWPMLRRENVVKELICSAIKGQTSQWLGPQWKF